MISMDKNSEQYETNADFLEFLNRAFQSTTQYATIEELAEFAFGSMEDAVEAFKRDMNN